ncbi:hypothetical protein [Luteimonas sp. R10]|uniref:hypothetical protein n=1 Tax=Luteimonas sp. R10 TaxID=3108176 RepID=UPI003091F2C8|nr:hypothetical protein U3649_03130 [Luteimonas sp. R10]
MNSGLVDWAYAGYLAWLFAGTLDFACHRRTDLAHTSGLPESLMHLLQLGLLALAILAGLLLDIGWSVWALMAALVALHAVAGYADTRRAYGRRDLRPFEQHVHSVLDMAPPTALGLVIAATWESAPATGWALAVRQPPLSPAIWTAVLVPPALLCAVPALLELRGALAARRGARP